ncbi:MAG: DUF4332 domain-containing protein [Candidatus Lokiarchaeota archaeon]|nr:DUF4332 domain-containing protein [Candidatus Lokiarchaeota archaeon]MBD3200615.1 DUF4332 domain-containing protein [Candidatus Lokiarchaeota archaeon]
MTDSMENLEKNKKEWDLQFLSSGVEQAISTEDFNQALKLAREGLEEAEGFSMYYTEEFEELIKAITLQIKNFDNNEQSANKSLENLEEEKETTNQIDPRENSTLTNENTELTQIPGIGDSTAQFLHQNGIQTIQELAKSIPENLAKIKGIGLKSAEKFIKIARYQLESISKSLKLEKTRPEKLELDSNQKQNLSAFQAEEQQNLKFIQEDSRKSYVRNTNNPIRDNNNRIEPEDFNEFGEEYNDVNNKIIKNHKNKGNGIYPEDKKESMTILKEISKLNKYRNKYTLNENSKPTKEIDHKTHNKEARTISNLSKFNDMIKTTFRDSKYHLFSLRNFSFDFLAIKRIELDNNKHLIYCLPILIDTNNEKILVSENELTLLNKDKLDVLGDIQHKYDQLIADTRRVGDDFRSKGDLLHLLERFLRTNLTRSNLNQSKRQIIYISGLNEYKLIIQSIFLCRKEPALTEKVIPFVYERKNRIYFTNLSNLPALISYLEVRYFEVNKYSNDDYVDEKRKELRYEHLDNIQKVSVPFMVIGFITLIISIFFNSLLTPISIIMMLGSLGLYFALLGYEFKSYQNKLDDSKLKNERRIDEIDLEILREELVAEEMEQLIYEEFGKNHNINYVKDKQRDSNSHLKIDIPQKKNSNLEKIEIRKDNISSRDHLDKTKGSVYEKYLDFLEE